MSARKVTTTPRTEKIEKAEVIETPAKVEKTTKATKAEKVEKEEKVVKAEKVVKKVEEKPEEKPKAEASKKAAPPKKEEAEETTEPSKEEESEEETIGEMIDNDIALELELLYKEKKSIDARIAILKRIQRNINIERKQVKKLLSKTSSAKKERSGSTGLDKMVPVQTSEFRKFVESNYQQLNDKDGNQILTTLTYDENDGSLMISRKTALKLVNAYAKHHSLQQYEDKKRIKMDKTLQKLFPNYAERKADDGSLVEENFYFCSIMGALTDHLKKDSESD